MIQAMVQYGARWDLALFERISDWNGWRVLDRLMYGLSKSADGWLYPAMALLLIALDGAQGLLWTACGALAFALELPAYRLLKRQVRRRRPCERLSGVRRLVHLPDRFSFPSGHTAGAFVVSRLLFAFHPACAAPAFLWASGVGLSRVYTGVHYPSDVLAGVLLGLASAEIAIRIVV
jgi:undecaprenyl-diphosphatase